MHPMRLLCSRFHAILHILTNQRCTVHAFVVKADRVSFAWRTGSTVVTPMCVVVLIELSRSKGKARMQAAINV